MKTSHAPLIRFVTKLIFSATVGLVIFGSLYCGSEDVETLTGDETGSVPGNFVVRLAPAFRDSVDSISDALSNLVPGTDFLSRFSGDNGSFGLNGESKLSDIYSVKIPDTGLDSANDFLFGSLKGLSDSSGTFFEQVDTDKYISNPVIYDPTAVDDPSREQQYYLDMINWSDAVASLTDAQIAAATPVVVGVLDTGVWAEHEDLADVMWRDPDSGEIKGYDAIDDSDTSNPDDINGHGTHVAGIIGAEGNNSKGIHGIGYIPQDSGLTALQSIVEIMSIKVLNDNGAGTSEYMTRGIRWAVQQHLNQTTKAGRDKQHLILNMSLGGPFETDGYDFEKDGEGNPVFSDDMFDYAAANNVLIIVAAGNESCGISGKCKIYGRKFKKTYYYPCSYQNVLCVAASDNSDALAGFSNRQASVGLTAPGWQILSTVPTTVADSTYAMYNGTSQATPVTAGAASLLWSMYPDFTATEIKAILQKSSAQVNTITDEISSGNGRLDLAKALSFAAELKESGVSPAEGEVDPATDANNKDLPDGASGDSSASSDKIDGDTNSRQKCGVIAGSATFPISLVIVLLPLISCLLPRLVRQAKI